MVMAGISSKAANRLDNRFKYNGIEHNTNFDLNMYDAFYRNLDPQIGRFWQIDPEAEMLEEYSPYASMYNNPISNVDPLGNFASRFGAWLHRLFKGGGSIGENQYGEWYVNKSRTEVNSDGSVTVIGSKYYGKGRDQYSSAREALARDYGMMADIQMNGEKSMYQMYESSEEAGNAALTYTGLLMPDPILKSGTIAANTPKVQQIEKVIEKIKIKFGNNPNQIHHTFRHTAEMGLARSTVQKAIEDHLPTVISKIQDGKPLNEVIVVAGQKIQYTAFKLQDCTINVGRIHAAK
jgi:RHS repeat-associated protein